MPRKERILLTPSGVGVTGPGRPEPVWQCGWNEVREVVAWKVDAFTDDVICIGLRISDEPEYLQVSEEADGWNELIAALNYRYGIHWSDWFSRVAFPAFQTNRTVLWSNPRGRSRMQI